MPTASSHFTLALAQTNTVVGDIEGNARIILDYATRADAQGADLVVFPEMVLTGYPPEDLVLAPAFRDAAMIAVEKLAQDTAHLNCDLLIGSVWHDGVRTYNASILLARGFVDVVRCKHELPNYGVFDEKRVFASGPMPNVLHWRGRQLGILICEEVWDTALPLVLKNQGAELLIVQNASPFAVGKAVDRHAVVQAAAQQTGLAVVYLNMVGGQDELVFDGRSYVQHPRGEAVVHLAGFEEQLALVTMEKQVAGWRAVAGPKAEPMGDLDTVYQALVLGLRDYVAKNGFKGVVIGLSGGVDSGLTAAVAVDALGAERVMGVLMPSPYTSRESIEDAEEQARLLGVRTEMVSITPGMEMMGTMLAPVFQSPVASCQSPEDDVTEQNIQARLRGNILMAISNKLGLMVLTTGNKSELSVGYATLYGDMCGGFSVLKDVYKTTVYKLCAMRNAKARVIPERMLTKAPSAELRPDQTDQDTLPPYDALDAMLMGLIERRLSVGELVKEGHDEATARRVARMLGAAEYKRRQAAPGVKITGMAFGRDRRYPITNAWKFE